VFSSPLSRAFETASIIATQLGVSRPEAIPAVAERDYGEAEGLNWEEIEAQFPRDTPVPGRETHEEVASRVVPALVELAGRHPAQALIVVSHGGVIRSVLNAVDPRTHHGAITNGSIHSFELVDGSLELISFDDPIDELSLECGTEDLDEQNAMESRDSVRG
jgi:probable phosphoglycerate mutase